MGDANWCRQYRNGQPKPSWLVNCVPFKKIPGPGIPPPLPPTPPPPPPVFFACRYNQGENTDWIINNLNCGYGEYSNFTFSATSLIINGVEYINSPIVSETIDIGNVDYVSASNSILSGCTLGDPTGVTYTNFVNFVNSVFTSVNADGYSAQLSYVDFQTPLTGGTCNLVNVNVTGPSCTLDFTNCFGNPVQYPFTGNFSISTNDINSISVGGVGCSYTIGPTYNTNFDSYYIIYPENDTFSLSIISNATGGAVTQFTQSGLTNTNSPSGFPLYYLAAECGYSVTNGQVIE